MSELRFEKATLTYSGNDRPAVNAFDLTVKDGEFLVLVGPVGAEYSVQAIDLGILCGRTGGHDRTRRSGRLSPSDIYLHLGAMGKRPALDRRRPICVTPVQGTWTTLSALTGETL